MKTKNKVEFEIGDEITFKPYEDAHRAKIVGVFPNRHPFKDSEDERVYYKVAGPRVVSTTTGESILESVYYTERKQ